MPPNPKNNRAVIVLVLWACMFQAERARAQDAAPKANQAVETAVNPVKQDKSLDAAPVHQTRASSLFFTPDQVKRLRAAQARYKVLQAQRAAAAELAKQQAKNKPQPAPHQGGDGGKDFLSTLTEPKHNNNGQPQAPKPPEPTPEPPQRTYFYPQFYLDFLMFHSTNSWSLMVNGRRFSSEDEPDLSSDLKVVGIGRERVMLEWKPEDMDRIKASWDVEQHPDVHVDYKAGTVTFPLRLNQTFSSYLMQSVEGRVVPLKSDDPVARTVNVPKPVVNGNPQQNPKPNPQQQNPKPNPQQQNQKPNPQGVKAPTGTAPTSDKDRTGLSGLLNSYKDLEKNKP